MMVLIKLCQHLVCNMYLPGSLQPVGYTAEHTSFIGVHRLVITVIYYVVHFIHVFRDNRSVELYNTHGRRYACYVRDVKAQIFLVIINCNQFPAINKLKLFNRIFIVWIKVDTLITTNFA